MTERAVDRTPRPLARGILDAAALRRALREHPAWKIEGQQLVRELRFKDFERAFACVSRLARDARDVHRHPDICLEGGNRVRVLIANPHHAGFTVAELRLVEKVDAVLQQSGLAASRCSWPRARRSACDEHATRHPVQRGRDRCADTSSASSSSVDDDVRTGSSAVEGGGWR
jgi:pterin-4a-carbinolamine dehydratase